MKEPEFDLEARGAARNNDPATSHIAANAMKAERLARLHGLIVDALRAAPDGLTTREITAITGVDWASITPRTPYLVAHGLAVDSGRTRRGESNRPSIVWECVR